MNQCWLKRTIHVYY